MSKKNKFKRKRSKQLIKQPVADFRSEGQIPKSSALPYLLRPHIVFAILAFIFGTLLLIKTPPFQVPDEIAHFDRAIKLSEFKTYQQPENNYSGEYIPRNIDSAFWLFRYLSWYPDKKVTKQQISEAFKIPLNNNDRKFTRIDAGAYYYLSYLPQYPAIYIGKLFNLNVLSILYLGRMFGLLFYIFCVYQAIRKIPFAKFLLLTVALMPICLAQAGSSNADCVAFAFSFLAIALLMKLSFSPNKISINKETIVLALILLSLGVLKVVYLPLIFLFFILPFRLFKNKQQYFSIALVLILLSVFFTYAWTSANTLSFDDPTTGAQEKIQALIHNPFLTFTILNETVPKMAEIWFHTAVGVLGYLDTVLPKWIYNLYAFLIIFLALFEGNRTFRLNLFQRVLLLIIPFIVFTGTILSMHLINGRENGFFVSGVQGRYFIPVIFPFFLAFTNLIPVRISLERNKSIIFILYFLIVIALTTTYFSLVERYYA